MRTSGDTVHLNSAEFTSYLRYRFHDQLASQLDSPSVAFSGDTLMLQGRFPTDAAPRHARGARRPRLPPRHGGREAARQRCARWAPAARALRVAT
jgi:hypothetical protein